MVYKSIQVASLLAISITSSCHVTAAFAPNENQVKYGIHRSNSQTAIASSTPTDDIFHTYGEESRKYRRTVYTHEDWVKHRSPDRFVRNLSSVTRSGVYKNVLKEVLATTSVAAFVLTWNCVFGTYQDFSGLVHDGPMHDSLLPILTLPLSPFTLLSPSLGLLLVFRTNTSYKRWDEARKNWGMNINHTRDLVRLGNAYYDRQAVSPERAEEDLKRLALCTWSFVRSMKRHLSPAWEDEEDFKKELYEKLPKEQAQNIIDAAHRPNRALQDISSAIENMPMQFMRKNEVHAAATIFEDNLGSSERLLSSPVPITYSRWSARFLSIWLLFLPFALWGPLGNSWNHIDILPVTSALSIFLFGIEELATQMEEPFTILPMQGFCDKIYNWINEIASFVPGDNGMPVYYYDNYDMSMIDGYEEGFHAGAPAVVGMATAQATTLSPPMPLPVPAPAPASVTPPAPKPASSGGWFRRAPEPTPELVEELEAVAVAKPPVEEPEVVPEPTPAEEPEATVAEPEVVDEPAVEVEPEVIPEPVAVSEPEPEEIPEPVAVSEPEPEVIPEPVAVAEPEPEVIPEPVAVAKPESEVVSAPVVEAAVATPVMKAATKTKKDISTVSEIEFMVTSTPPATLNRPKVTPPEKKSIKSSIKKFFKRK